MVRCGKYKGGYFIRETPGAALWRHVAMRPPSPAVVRMRCGGSAVRVQNSMAEVKLVNVKKIYPFVSGEEKKSKKKKKGEEPAEEKKVNLQITDKGVVAVQEFNLDIADKEFIVLVGPSGCGKSTTLRMVAVWKRSPRANCISTASL